KNNVEDFGNGVGAGQQRRQLLQALRAFTRRVGRASRRLFGGNVGCVLDGAFGCGDTLGEISRHFGEADQLPVGVSDCRYDDVRPEAAAVLSHAPPFVLELSYTRGDLELVIRKTFRDLLGGIEDREVSTDDLPGRVPLD